MTCEGCEDKVKKALGERSDIQILKIDCNSQQVLVETTLPSGKVQNIIESTGRRAVLKGYGASKDVKHLGAGVAMMSDHYDPPLVVGVVRFLQADSGTCLVDGTIDGLTPGKHGLHVHESGDLSGGCESLGEHYNPENVKHGNRTDPVRHVGDLGNIVADDKGRADFRFEDKMLKLSDVIGRSLAVTSAEDDLGRGKSVQSQIDGNSGFRIACGIIARSAGLFANPKKVCLCSGATLWDERSQAPSGL